MFRFGTPRPARRPGLTPMIDVVFLLLVFFMLAARFGDTGALPLGSGGGGAPDGPPRLIDIGPDGLWLNGIATAPGALAGELAALAPDPGDPVVLRPLAGSDLQRLVDVADALAAAGFTALVVIEGPAE